MCVCGEMKRRARETKKARFVFVVRGSYFVGFITRAPFLSPWIQGALILEDQGGLFGVLGYQIGVILKIQGDTQKPKINLYSGRIEQIKIATFFQITYRLQFKFDEEKFENSEL